MALSNGSKYLTSPSEIPVTASGSDTERTLGDWVSGIPYTHENVSDMMADASLATGSIVRTQGFHDKGLGADDYLVVDAPAASGFHLPLANGRYAKASLDSSTDATKRGAKGDGSKTELSSLFSSLGDAQVAYPSAESLSDSFDWAAIQFIVNEGRVADVPKGDFLLSRRVDVPSGAGIHGRGVAEWTAGNVSVSKIDAGTNLIFYGEGARDLVVDNVGAGYEGRGIHANPDASSPYTSFAPAPSYELTDFTNADASGATPATLRAFSAAIATPVGGNTSLKDFRVIPDSDGMNNYLDWEETGLGDDWDVGILHYNGCYNKMDNVQAVGYWRIAGVAKIAAPEGTENVQGESASYSRCIFQGYRGLLIRSMDEYEVVSSSDAQRTLRINWSKSHRWPSSGSFRLAGTDRTYSGLDYVVDGGTPYLEFTGVTGNLGSYGSIFTIRKVSSHFGTSGSDINDCTISGLNHHTRLAATSPLLDTPFSLPSAALEVSGIPLRAIIFNTCTLVTWEDVLLMTNSSTDMQFVTTYFEGQQAFSQIASFEGQLSRGGRMIATPRTRFLDFVGSTHQESSVDRRPYSTVNPSSTRFTSGEGLFNPREIRDDRDAIGFNSSSREQIIGNPYGDSLTIPAQGQVRVQHGESSAMLVGSESGGRSVVQGTAGTLKLASPIRHILGGTADGNDWVVADSSRLAPSKGGVDLGDPTNNWEKLWVNQVRLNDAIILTGLTSPEGDVTAPVGSLYVRLDGGPGSTLYVKETGGGGSTGWSAK